MATPTARTLILLRVITGCWDCKELRTPRNQYKSRNPQRQRKLRVPRLHSINIWKTPSTKLHVSIMTLALTGAWCDSSVKALLKLWLATREQLVPQNCEARAPLLFRYPVSSGPSSVGLQSGDSPPPSSSLLLPANGVTRAPGIAHFICCQILVKNKNFDDFL